MEGTAFSLQPEVVNAFPSAQVRFVVAHGLRNDEPWGELEERMRELESEFARGAWEPLDEADIRIASWHDAYRRFGTNPRRSRPSLDALSRRMRKTGSLPRISPAVDAYNLISVTHGTPAGAFDMASLNGDVAIRFAQPGDTFVPLGEPDVVEEPSPGEVVYALGDRVLTRHWNHRDSDETKVTEASTEVVFILERVSESAVGSAEMVEAQAALARIVGPHSLEVVLAAIDPDAPATELLSG